MPHSKINVLDFGCGTGNYIKAITTYTNYHIYGVEPCEAMIAYAKKQNRISLLDQAITYQFHTLTTFLNMYI